MWFDESVFYQIYPLGYVGAERQNDFVTQSHRFSYIEENIKDIKELGANVILFNPLFQSSCHGYDTADFYKVDSRLGTNDEFKKLCKVIHQNDIKIVLDGVFNQVGRDFFAFKDVLQNRENSRFKDWFYINFSGNTNYNDGLYYEPWEGHYELVKLNLSNPELLKYLEDAIKMWIDEFEIDGLRLDVCYSLPEWFMEHLKRFTKTLKEDFVLIGEVIHAQNFAKNLTPERLNSITGYECYKGMISSFNSYNLFEIEYSLTRLFSNVDWALMRGKNLLNFLDNHDVTRVYTNLSDKKHIKALYALLFSIPGVPQVYYGSEYGIEGRKENTDYDLRPFINNIDKTKNKDLFEYIKKLCEIRVNNKVLSYGGYNKKALSNKYMAFEREYEGNKIYFAVNIAEQDVTLNLAQDVGTDLLTEKQINLSELKIASGEALIIKIN